MKISLSMWSVHSYWYSGRWSVVDFIRFTSQKTQASAVELLSMFWRNLEAELPLVKEALRETGLELACYCACNNFCYASPEKRREQLKEVTDSVDMAFELGAPTVRVFSGDLPDDGSVSYEQGFEYILEGLTASARYAEERGIHLCLENHGLFAGRTNQILDLINRVSSPNLHNTFDVGNFLLVNEQPVKAVKSLVNCIRHVHMKDYVEVHEEGDGIDPGLNGRLFLCKIVGEGTIDLDTVVSELTAHHYPGWYTVEFEGIEEPEEGSIRAVANACTILGRLTTAG